MSFEPRSVVVHGHFYQPPREDPWTGRIPVEPSAAPFHDWNQRIEHECYRPVTEARVLGPEGEVARVINTLEWLSYDVGPTLLRWLERAAPETYRRFLAGDAASARRLGGHGGAMACPYHHLILPLASRRDKVTEVRWGIRDFRHRFGRDPQGMWLPETAVDEETLVVLAEEGIAFTVLAPTQVGRAPAGGLPGRFDVGGGRSIAVFVYDGELSHGVAFGDLTRDGVAWAHRVSPGPAEPGGDVLAIATDGETFGHHHTFAEMALAAALDRMDRDPRVRVETFSSVLARHGPGDAIDLVEPSSWSCAHGVERWRSDCGCKMAPGIDSQQAWRAPLRDAFDWLADELARLFERVGNSAFDGDPWEARDAAGGQRYDAPGGSAQLDASSLVLPLSTAESLLEMQRSALAMFTSCGWFFDDLAGLEPTQVLRYAVRALERAGAVDAELAETLLVGLRGRLAEARSNDPEHGSGADLLDRIVAGAGP